MQSGGTDDKDSVSGKERDVARGTDDTTAKIMGTGKARAPASVSNGTSSKATALAATEPTSARTALLLLLRLRRLQKGALTLHARRVLRTVRLPKLQLLL
jgi:hypothetical protein